MLVDNIDNNLSAAIDTKGPDVFDVSVVDFEAKVLAASLEVPVLVDFWAPWCGPCKQLMPILEKIIMSHSGSIKLAKVNIDDNPELAQALQVQSVPMVYAFFQGQPINAFTGAKTQGEIEIFVSQVLASVKESLPDVINIEEVMAQADMALAQKDFATSQMLYMQILSEDKNNMKAYAGIVRVLIAAGEIEKAQQFVDESPEEIIKSSGFESVKAALDVAAIVPEGNISDLQNSIAKSPEDYQARFDLATALYAAGEKEQAIDQLIDIIRLNREWEDQKARIQLLQFFEAMGPMAPETLTGRRKLSAVLFS